LQKNNTPTIMKYIESHQQIYHIQIPMQLSDFLQEYDFTPRQSKVYLATLELGNAPASSIARFCGENRLTTYSVLKELIKKWFAQEKINNSVKFYTASSPDLILNRQKYKTEQLESKLPELMAMMNTLNNKPKVKFYEGHKSMEEAYMDTILEKDSTMLSFLWVSSLDREFKIFLDKIYLPERIKMNINAKVLLQLNEHTVNYKKQNKKILTETLMIDDDLFDLCDELILYWENKILISLFHKSQLSSISIQSKTLYKTMESIHKLLRKIYSKK